MLTAIVGINWGDEGKGRMVDLLSQSCQVVARYQGGNNAGHTILAGGEKFVLNLLPSGILRQEVVNILGPGMVIDIAHLRGEMSRLAQRGVEIGPERLRISGRACICLPANVRQDCLEEDRLAGAKFGSTRRGIGPIYGDKYMKKALRMEDLLEPERLERQLARLLDWKNLLLKNGYGAAEETLEATLSWLREHGEPLKPYICDTGAVLEEAIAAGKDILFEAQLGALRDIDYGIYPYTSSSTTLAAYAPIGAGIPGRRLDRVVGVMKAYSTCVGEGPFPCELFGAEAEALREAGGEYGAATGRPRRVGPFDVPASRYGVRVQGADEVALTKLDVLSGMGEIPVCTGYRVDGVVTEEFPSGGRLERAEAVVERLPGWGCDIGGCRRWQELPEEARRYVTYLEEAVRCPIRYVSVGADREAYILRE